MSHSRTRKGECQGGKVMRRKNNNKMEEEVLMEKEKKKKEVKQDVDLENEGKRVEVENE